MVSAPESRPASLVGSLGLATRSSAPASAASIASLASRSACEFSARGTHSKSTRSNCATSSAARAASGFIAACLTFHRPDICSTTSLESIRAVTRDAPSVSAASSPAISPEYSATLLVATPTESARSASTVPSGANTTAP